MGRMKVRQGILIDTGLRRNRPGKRIHIEKIPFVPTPPKQTEYPSMWADLKRTWSFVKNKFRNYERKV